MSLSKPNSDTQRRVLPPPPGRQASRQQGLNTLYTLMNKTGLTKLNENRNPVIAGDTGADVMAPMVRIFAALPGVSRSDIVQPYRGMIVRK